MIKNGVYSVIIIGLCLVLGKLFSALLGGLPASLYGMLLFTTSLHFKWVNPTRISDTISFIIKHMGVCFVPAGVGIINHFQLIKAHGFSLVLIVFFTTFLLLSFVGLVYQRLINVQLAHAKLSRHKTNECTKKGTF